MKRRKDSNFVIRLTPEERRALEKRSSERGETITAYIRRLLQLDLERNGASASAPHAELTLRLEGELERTLSEMRRLRQQADEIILEHPENPEKNLRRSQLGLVLTNRELEALKELPIQRHASIYDAVERFATGTALAGDIVRSVPKSRDVVSVSPGNLWHFIRTDASNDLVMRFRAEILEAAGWSSSAKGENVVESKPPTSRKRRRG